MAGERGNIKYMSTDRNTELKAKDIFPMNWRFFPTIDPQVDFFISRDLDSEFNEREISGKIIQVYLLLPYVYLLLPFFTESSFIY